MNTKSARFISRLQIVLGFVVALTAELPAKGIGVIGPDGWTVLEPSEDSRLVYVSSSEGSDTNDGFSPEAPLKTIDAARFIKIRNGRPDWMLLKRGDTFPHVSLGSWKSGRSAEEPVVITSYGDSGPRPVIKLTGPFIDWNGQAQSHVAIVGLDFHRSISDIDSADFTNTSSSFALRFIPGGEGPATNLLVEDCLLRYCEMVVHRYQNSVPTNVHIRRNVVINNWGHDTSLSTPEPVIGPQGLFVGGVVDFYFVENLFHHNGWTDRIAGAGGNQYNHNLYMGTDNGGEILVMGNIISYAAANGIQLRSGGTAIMNAFVGNAIGMNLGYSIAPEVYTGLTRADDNVFTDGRRQSQGGQYATSAVWGLWKQTISNVTVNDNIVANINATSGSRAPYNAMSPNQFGTGNIAWNWYEGNTSALDPLWPDHTRDGDSYGDYLGYEDWDGFIAAAANRGVREFTYELSAYGYVDYIREGFNRPPVTPPYSFASPSFAEIIGATVVSQENGLYTSAWLGDFYVLPLLDNWLYHAGLGWCYTGATDSESSVILWAADTGSWVYTHAEIFPWYWNYDDEVWAVFGGQ